MPETTLHVPRGIEMSDDLLPRLLAHHRRFLAFLERRVSRADAEEILQDAFVRALTGGDSIREEESAVAWFYRVLRHALVDRERRQAVHERWEAREVERRLRGPDEELERFACECLADLIPELDPRDRDLVRRVDLQGEPVGAVATDQAITVGNARVRLHRARRELARLLGRVCRTCATHGCLDCTCREPSGSC